MVYGSTVVSEGNAVDVEVEVGDVVVVVGVGGVTEADGPDVEEVGVKSGWPGTTSCTSGSSSIVPSA